MVRIKSGYNYVGLVKELALTDFKLKYQGSVFGYLWSLVKPFAYFAVLYIVFTKIFKIGNSVPHYPIYLLLGVMMFSFWGEATSVAMSAIVTKGDLIRKVYFPRIVLVISSTITSLITFVLNMLVLGVFAYINGVRFGIVEIVIFIALIAELYLFILGVSFYLSSLFVKFRDVGHIWEVVNQILFYATPIVYPLSIVPANYGKIITLSPLAQIIQDARSVLIGFDAFSTRTFWGSYWLIYLLVIFIFISGYFLFQKMAAKFAEEV